MIEIIRVVLALLAGYSFCIIIITHKIVSNPDGYIVVNQNDAKEDFIRLEMKIDFYTLIKQRYVILKVTDEK